MLAQEKARLLNDFLGNRIGWRQAGWPARGVIGAGDSLSGDSVRVGGGGLGTGAWPAASRALFYPFTVDLPVVAYKMAWENGTQNAAANIDVGIYNEALTRLVSSGPTAMGTGSTIQIVDITDTPLVPGLYYMAMVCDTVTTATFQRLSPGQSALRAAGAAQQASAATLPNPAVFAVAASGFLPTLSIACTAVI